MSQVLVTELIVDASQAQAGITAYEAAMQKLAKASADAAEREARLQAAVDRSTGVLRLVPPATDRATQAWLRLGASVDPTVRQMQAIDRATNQAASAVRGGAATLDQAAQRLDAVRAKQEQVAASWRRTAGVGVEGADALRMSYDSAYANAARYAEVEQQVARHIGERTLSVENGNVILAGARDRFKQLGDGAKGANDNVRLTSNQMGNLGYQLNDVATMLAMGASPFQIISSQAGQVVQALGDGPQGVRGSLRAIGSAARTGALAAAAAIGPVGIGLAAITAAAVGVGVAFRQSFPSTEEVLERHAAVLDRIVAEYENVKDAIDEVRARSGGIGLNVEAGASLRDTRLRIKAEREALEEAFVDRDRYAQRLAEGTALSSADMPAASQFEPIRRMVEEFREDLRRGAGDAVAFRQRLGEMHRAAGNDTEMQTAIEAADTLALKLYNLQIAAGEAGAAISGMQGRVGRLTAGSVADMRDRFGGWQEALARTNPEALATIVQGLREQADELTETDRAAEDYRKSMDDLRAGWSDDAAALRLQVEMFGRSEGAIAAARFQTEALAEARRLAADANERFDENGADAQRIRQVASEIGVLTDRIDELGEAEQRRKGISDALGDLQFEGTLIGLPQIDRDILTQLRELKLTQDDADGAAIAGQMRVNDLREKANEDIQKQNELLRNLGSTFLDIFDATSADSFFDRILGGLADIGRQLAEVGKNKILENLFGEGFGYTSGQPEPGRRSIFPVGIPNFGGGAANDEGARVPQAITAELSANVTQTVSDNLLQSMLGAGKDPAHIRGLNADFASSLTQMFQAAPEAIRASVTINSGFRSVARQAELFEQALAKYGSEAAARKWVAPPGRSQHNFGNAVDLGYGNDAARRWVHENAGRFGLRFPMAHENWHIEPVGARGGGSVTALRSAVRDGSIDATRALASGQAGIASGSLPSGVPIPSARPQGGGALGGGDALSGVRNFLSSPMGQAGIAGVTAFAGGMQSGSPAGGALQGALGGFMVGGPIGGVIGAVGGLLGGLFGSSRRKREERRQRAEQERQQRLQAQQQLDQQLPAILELQDTLLDRASGTLLREQTRIAAQLKQYEQLAKTAKNKGEQQRLASMREDLEDYMARLFDQVRLTSDSIILSLEQGRGLEPEFAKAVAGIREQGLAVRNYLADLAAATGENSEAVQRGNHAGRVQLLRQLSGAEEVSEIYTRMDTLMGTAAQLGYELQKLGMNADDAAKAIRENLNVGIANIRDEFVRGITDEMAEATDLGYLAQIRGAMERRDTMRADAQSLGVDPALVDQWFRVQAQAIADGAGLAADELKVLTDVFPELTGVVTESLSSLQEAQAEAESDLRRAWEATEGAVNRAVDQLKQFQKSIRDFLDGLKLNADLSTLTPGQRLAEAEKQFRDTYAKAIGGDTSAQAELARMAQTYLEEGRAYWSSSEQYAEIYDTVTQMMKRADVAATSRITEAERQLSVMREQVAKLIDIDDEVAKAAEMMEKRLLDVSGIVGFLENQTTGGLLDLGKMGREDLDKLGVGLDATMTGLGLNLNADLIKLDGSTLTVAGAVEKLIATTAAVDAAQAARDATQAAVLVSVIKALKPEVPVPSYNPPNVGVTPIAPPTSTPPPGPPALQNVSLWNGSSHQNYVGNWKDVKGRQVFVPSGWSDDRAYALWITNHQYRNGANGIPSPGSGKGPTRNEKRFGGAIGFGFNGLGYENGGVVANGLWDVDSVMARHRDGGHVWLAGGEGILTAPAMRLPGVPQFMEAANSNRLTMPSMAAPAAPPLRMNFDTGGIVRAIERLELRLDQTARAQVAATLDAGEGTAKAVRETSEATDRRAAADARMAQRQARAA